jgi:hypothetical protein
LITLFIKPPRANFAIEEVVSYCPKSQATSMEPSEAI